MQLGPYELLEELGRGGMGVVHRARHVELGHEVALKTIAAGDGAGREAIDRFRREAQAAGTLTGTPGLVGVRDSGIDAAGETLWLAMDYIAGESLEAVVRGGELDARGAATLVAAAADAVAAAHAKGFIHRDLKPGNILVARDGTPWVTDFGLVRREQASAEVTRLTRSGEIVGTPAYMAPEQVMGGAVDARTDVYGLGATLYETLTGTAPFVNDSMLQVLQRTINDPPPAAPLRSAGVDAGLQHIVLCALAKRPEERYPDAAALAADLRNWLAGAPVQAARRRASGTPLLPAAGVVVLALSAGAAWWFSGPRDGPAAPAPPQGLEMVTAEAKEAELAADRFQRYVAVDQATGPHLARLQARWFGAPVPNADVLAAVDGVEAALTASGGAPGPHAASWRAMAAYFAGQESGLFQLEQEAAGAGPDPFPRLLHARLLLARYLHAVRLPGASHDALPSTITFVESEEAKARRAEFDGALAAMRAAAWWGLAPADPFVAQLGEVAKALATEDYEAVAVAAEQLGSHAGLAPIAADLSAFARFQLRDFQAAGDAWAVVIERLGDDAWPGLHRRAAQARCWQAVRAKEPQAKIPIARAAIAHADRALAADTTDVTARLARLSACADLGKAVGGTEGRRWMLKGVADADFLVELTDGAANTIYERALMLTTLGYECMGAFQYDEANRHFARAQADAAHLVERNPGSHRAHSIRTLAFEMQAALDDHFQRDSRAALRTITESLRVMLAIRHSARTAERLLRHSSHLAWSETRYGGDPHAALETAEELLRSAPEESKNTRTCIDWMARTYLAWGNGKLNEPDGDPTYALMRAAELYARLPGNRRAEIARLTGLTLLVRWSKNRDRLDAAQTAMALAAASEAAARLPAEPDVHAMRGGLLVALDREDDAVAALERALELKPDHALARRQLAALRARRGK